MAKMFQDADGNTSSKRVNGSILIWVGLGMVLVTWAVSLFNHIGDAKTCVELCGLTLALGGGMDTAGIFDKLFGRKKKNA